MVNLILVTFLSSASYAFVSNAPHCLRSGNYCLKASSSPRNQEGDGKAKAKKSVAKSVAAPKKAVKAVKEAKKMEKVDKPKEIVFRKPDFIDKMASKTGMTKADSETALSAVLEIITEV